MSPKSDAKLIQLLKFGLLARELFCFNILFIALFADRISDF